jgi:hypothetical protein
MADYYKNVGRYKIYLEIILLLINKKFKKIYIETREAGSGE